MILYAVTDSVTECRWQYNEKKSVDIDKNC